MNAATSVAAKHLEETAAWNEAIASLWLYDAKMTSMKENGFVCTLNLIENNNGNYIVQQWGEKIMSR